MPSPSTRAEVAIILRRLVKAGVILGSRTNLGRESSDDTEEIHVTAFVAPEADSTETPSRGDERAVRRQRDITVYGCVLAVVLAILIGMYLPGVGRLIGLFR